METLDEQLKMEKDAKANTKIQIQILQKRKHKCPMKL